MISAASRFETEVTRIADQLEVLHLTLTSPRPAQPPRLGLKWSLPSHDLAGHWMTSRVLNKSIRPDWTSGRLQPTMFAKEAPVSTLFSSTNQNILTFAVPTRSKNLVKKGWMKNVAVRLGYFRP